MKEITVKRFQTFYGEAFDDAGSCATAELKEAAMTIEVAINSCADCRHLDHSGGWTPGGAQQICGHASAAYASYGPGFGKQEPYHWKHRVIYRPNPTASVIAAPIPDWCPLKHGAGY